MVATQSWRNSASCVGVALLIMGISSCLALLENEKEISRFLQGDENAESRVKHGTKGIELDHVCGSASFDQIFKAFKDSHAKTQSVNYKGSVVADPKDLVKQANLQLKYFDKEMLDVESEIETIREQITTTMERITQIEVVLEKERKSVSDMSMLDTFWDNAGNDFMLKEKEQEIYVGCLAMDDEGKTEKLLDTLQRSLRALKEPNNNRQFPWDLWETSCLTRAFERLQNDLKGTKEGFKGGKDEMQHLLVQAQQAEEDGEDVVDDDMRLMYLLGCRDFCSDFAQRMHALETTVFEDRSETHTLVQEQREKERSVEQKEKFKSKISRSTISCRATKLEIEALADNVGQAKEDISTAHKRKTKVDRKRMVLFAKKKKLNKKEEDLKEQIEKHKKECTEKSEFVKNISCELRIIRTRITEQKKETEIHIQQIRTQDGKLREIVRARDAYLEMKKNLMQTLLSWLQIEIKISETVSSSVNAEVLGIHAIYLRSSQAAQDVFIQLGQDFPEVFPKVYDEMRDQIEEEGETWLSAHIEKTFITTSSSRFKDIYESSNSDFQSVVTMFMAHCQNESPGKGFCRKFLPGWYDQARCGNEKKCEYPCQGDPCTATQDVGKYLLDDKFKELVKGKENQLEQLNISLEVHVKESFALGLQLQMMIRKQDKHKKGKNECEEQRLKLTKILTEEVALDQEDAAMALKELQKISLAEQQNKKNSQEKAIATNNQIEATVDEAKMDVAQTTQSKKSRDAKTSTTTKVTTKVTSDSNKVHKRGWGNTGSND